jgi:hypothetical protein
MAKVDELKEACKQVRANYGIPRRPAPIRALSPSHLSPKDGPELPPEYLHLLLERAKRYGYNQLHYANNPVQNDLDQFVHYEAFPGLEAAMGKSRGYVEERVALFRDITTRARAAGIETFLWHHELNFPEALARLHPEGFKPGIHKFSGDKALPIPDLDSPVIWDFMTARLEEAYRKLPDLTGIVLVVQESDIAIYHLAEDQAVRAAHTRRLLDFMNEAHRRLGRKWILRAFCWREWEYAALREALRGFDPEIPVEIKATPMDWQLFYPRDGLISALNGERQTLVEMDLGGNFWGECEVPAVNAGYYADELLFALEHGGSGAVVRCDRWSGHTFDKPMELNIAVVGALLNDPGRCVGEVEQEWLRQTYGAAALPAKRLLDHAWEVMKRMNFVDGAWVVHHRFNHAARGSCNLFVGERDLAFEPGDLAFRREIELAGLHVEGAERELVNALAATGHAAPTSMPATLHGHVFPAPHPLDELARQVRNLRERHDYFSALKEFHYALRVRVYDRSPEALAEGERRLADLERCLRGRPYLAHKQPDFIPQLAELLEGVAPREILQGRHFSCGEAFHGKSYAMPFPAPVACRLPVRPGAMNILVIFTGTHMCREAVADVTVAGRRIELRRGTMAWFWAYDGWRRWEFILPAELVTAGEVEVFVQGRDGQSAPFITEIRTEVEGEGLKPRLE